MRAPYALTNLREAALETFSRALAGVDAGAALRRKVRRRGSLLTLCDARYDLDSFGGRVYAVAIGKAALSMASALDDILRGRLTAGVLAAPSQSEKQAHKNLPLLSTCWRVFQGGHPLPNQESLQAAHAAMCLVRQANRERALLIFLISGGGSAIFEWPVDESITLEELREANRVLVSCGATIAEVNSVRRAFSSVKGGRLSALAPETERLSLIVSDTNPLEEWAVASGPTLAPPEDSPQARDVLARYHLEKLMPASVVSAVNQSQPESMYERHDSRNKHHLLLDNGSALKAAARAIEGRGFAVEIAADIIEQPIATGCRELLSRLEAGKSLSAGGGFCLISGGEFVCPVRGDGLGGRNAETVLRMAIEIEKRRRDTSAQAWWSHVVILSAGTDGIDGNSPAAGAIADETTFERARARGLDAFGFLERSDAYSLFNALDDAITTGPTGTNVRDLRIILAQ
jgi:glycerate 2-kinase